VSNVAGALLDYSINCAELPDNTDLHYLLAYRVNPKLAEITNKYYDFEKYKKKQPRTLEMWINEYDGARIRVLYTFDDKSFEETIVDWLFNLRDFLISHKMDFNAFRRYVADLAFLAAHRSPGLFKDVEELLGILGCTLWIKSMKKGIKINEEDILRMLNNFAVSFDVKSEDVVRVTIKVTRGGKPVRNATVRITNIVQERGTRRSHETKLVTNENGTIMIPARKFSVLRVKVGSKEETLIVGSTDEVLGIDLGKRKTWIKIAVTLSALGALLTLFLLYLLLL